MHTWDNHHNLRPRHLTHNSSTDAVSSPWAAISCGQRPLMPNLLHASCLSASHLVSSLSLW